MRRCGTALLVAIACAGCGVKAPPRPAPRDASAAGVPAAPMPAPALPSPGGGAWPPEPRTAPLAIPPAVAPTGDAGASAPDAGPATP